MGDLLIVLTIVAFFGTCVAYVSWCDTIIGADEPADAPVPAVPADGGTGGPGARVAAVEVER